MEPSHHSAGPSFDLRAALHRAKVWLNAPVGSQRPVRPEAVRNLSKAALPADVASEVRSEERPTAPPRSVLHDLQVWLSSPVGSHPRALSKNAENDHNRVASNAGSTVALVIHVCWLSIVLGLVIQIALLTASVAFGRAPKLNPLVVDLA